MKEVKVFCSDNEKPKIPHATYRRTHGDERWILRTLFPRDQIPLPIHTWGLIIERSAVVLDSARFIVMESSLNTELHMCYVRAELHRDKPAPYHRFDIEKTERYIQRAHDVHFRPCLAG